MTAVEGQHPVKASPGTAAGGRWYRAMWTRRGDFAWNPSRRLAWGAVVTAAALYSVIAWSARFPVIPLDEVVMVGNSRVISGVSGEWTLSGGGFMPGLAILMAPVWWFTQSAVVVYQVGIWITVALSLLAIWPLSAIAERAGLSRNGGVIVSALVVMAPARSLLANYLLSDSALLLATAALVVAGDRLWVLRRNVDALWFGVTVGATVLAHGRGVGTAVAAGLWGLLLLRRSRQRATIAMASALVFAFAAFLLYTKITGALLSSDARVGGSFGDLSGRDVGASLASGVGQLWYGTLAWPAVAVLGGLALLRWRRGGMASLVLLGSATALVLATFQLDPQRGLTRIDPWFYGRYMDQWWPILAVVGLAVLVRVKWPLMAALTLGVSAVSGLGMLFITVPSIPRGMGWEDIHVLGISPWLRLDDYANGREQSWGVIVLTAIALTLLVLALGLMRVWVLPILAALWIWLSIAQDVQGIDLRLGDRAPSREVFGLGLLPADATIGVDEGIGQDGNMLVFAAAPTRLVEVDPLAPPNGVDVVYVSWLKANAEPPGVKIFAPTVGTLFDVWIEPGALQDRMDAQGLLSENE